MPVFSATSRFPKISSLLPSAITCPCHSTIIRWAHSQTSCISWVAIITVSVIFFISLSVLMISFRVAISRLAVGSSSSRISGFSAMPMARLPLRICPPDSSLPSRCRRSESRNRSRSLSVFSCHPSRFRTCMAKAMSCSMESLINISSGF